jgi:hypothetical protein
VTPEPSRIEDLRIEARYRRERYDLYRAKMYGPRPTTLARLRELERAHVGADARLRRAQQEVSAESQALVLRDQSSAPGGSTNRDAAPGADPPLT